MKVSLKYYGPAILWALFVLFMCSIKLGKISSSPMFFPGFDKLVHCGFFFVLVVFCCMGLIKQQTPKSISYTSAGLITVLMIIYGGIIELLQLWVFTWRSGEWDDLFADAIGALMGAFGVMITFNAIKYVKN